MVAASAALNVAEYLRVVFRRPLEVFTKKNFHDPVTVHDRWVENRLYTLLGGAVPNSLLLGEETGEHQLSAHVLIQAARHTGQNDTLTQTSGDAVFAEQLNQALQLVAKLGERVRWIVDPIDGTSNFASGINYFNTSIAAELDGQVVAGVVNAPIVRELFVADDQQAWLVEAERKTQIFARGATEESRAVLTGYFPYRDPDEQHSLRAWQRARELARSYATIHSPGSAALDLAHVAAGHTSVAIGTAMKPWDVAAGFHLVKVAGGKVITYETAFNQDCPPHLRGIFVAQGRDLEAKVAQQAVAGFAQDYSGRY